MILSLAEKYIEAINSGGVPNIESSWTYMCQNECLKVINTTVAQFKNRIGSFNVPDADLELKLDQAKLVAICFFLEKC